MSKQNIILQPLGLAIVLTLGFTMVIALLGILIVVAPIEGSQENDGIREDILVQRDGTIFIIHWEEYKPTEGRTLDGKKISVSFKELIKELKPALLPGPLDLKITGYQFPLEVTNRIVFVSSRYRSLKEASWYFVHDGNLEGKGYFIGFDRKSGYCIGYYSRLGPSQNIPPAQQWFPLDGRNFIWTVSNSHRLEEGISILERIMISEDQLLLFSLPVGPVKTLMESNDLIFANILNLGKFWEKYEHDPDLWILRTVDHIILFDMEGKQVRSYLIPEDLRKPEFKFHEIGNENGLFLCERKYPVDKGERQLTWIDTSGKILRREEIVLAGIEPDPISGKTEGWVYASVVPAPVFMFFGALVLAPMEYLEKNIYEEISYANALGRTLPNVWAPLLAECILAAVLAWFCYRRQRRMAQPWTWIWVGFVFLFGVPGFLGYLFHRRWPVLENCHVCGHAVPHDREKCSSCESEFPAPAPKGIEVFA